jgi:hypothetical protein
MNQKLYLAAWVLLPSLAVGFGITALALIAEVDGLTGGLLAAVTATLAIACFLAPLALLEATVIRP